MLLNMAPANPTPRTIPTFLAVARMPDAIPCRSRGALPNSALVFGEMKMPVPNPVTARLMTVCKSGELESRRDKRNRPAAMIAIPTVDSKREPIRSDRLPLIGAEIAITIGCAVSRIPDWAGFKPRPWIR